MKNARHCRPVTRTPQAAQTNSQFKTLVWLDFVEYTSNLAIGITRGKPWGVVFPFWFEAIDDFDGGDGDGGNNNN
jgi:hypothetical protein